jgi:hypothetical protein
MGADDPAGSITGQTTRGFTAQGETYRWRRSGYFKASGANATTKLTYRGKNYGDHYTISLTHRYLIAFNGSRYFYFLWITETKFYGRVADVCTRWIGA